FNRDFPSGGKWDGFTRQSLLNSATSVRPVVEKPLRQNAVQYLLKLMLGSAKLYILLPSAVFI
ncbi:hypothetical protein P0G10_20000, partial [Eubacteriales bacterium DFI.9.88]|nr:hypothetical protein [Eubacteriales bacterium DFI.9.88]